MNTEITIHDRELAEDEHLHTAMRVVLRHQRVERAEIFVSPRDSTGWLEYIVRLKYATGGGMTIGVIQRNVGEGIECHS